MARALTVKQREFIAGIQAGKGPSEAAIAAGYSPQSAKHTAHHLLHKNELVRAELDKVRARLADVAQYNGERAMAEAEKAMAFAERTDNANAMVRAIELRARLAGLMRDKLDITIEHPDINQALTEAKARVLRPMRDPADTIDGEFVALPSEAEGRAIDS